MAKRGRGGAGMGSRMNPQNLPFEIDPDLVEAADAHHFSSDPQQKHDSAKELFPDFGPILPPFPITDSERRQVSIWRELDAKRRSGPFWTGTKDDWVRVDALSVRNANAAMDPFECMSARRGVKRGFRMADLRRVKLEPKFFPKELYKTIGADEDDEDSPNKRQRRLGLAKKSAMDRLAKFDDDHEEQVNGETNDEEETSNENEEGEDLDAEPVDDDFDEDDDDVGNDYNAEQYFDGGEDDFDEGGEGGGGDDVF